MSSRIIPDITILISLLHSLSLGSTSTSVLLTPGNPSLKGASVQLIKGVTDYAPFEWDLYAMDERQFNMKIHLNKSWSFHPQHITTLTLQINSDTSPDTTDTSLIISFSQNHTKYITSIIQIGARVDNEDHFIYPPPFDDLNEKQRYGEGDIEALVSNTNTNTNIDRVDATTNNGSYGYFYPFTSSPIISYPLQFSLQNNPYFNYMIFTYDNPFCQARHIIYYGLDTNQTFDIYFAAADTGDNFDITSFHLTHEYLKEEIISTVIIMPEYVQDIEINSVDWFQTSLVMVLIATIVILCCICCLFAVMFSKMLRNHKQMIEKKQVINYKKETDKTKTVIKSQSNSDLKVDTNNGENINEEKKKEMDEDDDDFEDMYITPTTTITYTTNSHLTLSSMISGVSVPEGTISKHLSNIIPCSNSPTCTIQSCITPYAINQHPIID